MWHHHQRIWLNHKEYSMYSPSSIFSISCFFLDSFAALTGLFFFFLSKEDKFPVLGVFVRLLLLAPLACLLLLFLSKADQLPVLRVSDPLSPLGHIICLSFFPTTSTGCLSRSTRYFSNACFPSFW